MLIGEQIITYRRGLKSQNHINGVDKTKAFSKEKWQDTKEFSAEKSAVVKDKAGDVKHSVEHNTKKSGHYIADKAKQGQQATKQKWQETKQAVSGQPKRADVNGQAQVELDTPVAKAKVGSSTDVAVGAKQKVKLLQS